MSELKCRYCGKSDFNGKTQQAKAGALRLHEYHCRVKQLLSQEQTQQQQVEQVRQECDHKWRMLNPYNKTERIAIENGFWKVCDKCETLK